MPTHPVQEAPRVIHLVPREEGWVLLGEDGSGDGPTFPDLGRALDAATSGDAPVRVIVHERGAA